jgi:hypothetical protein
MKNSFNKVVALLMLTLIGSQAVAGCKRGRCNVGRGRQSFQTRLNAKAAAARKAKAAKQAPKAKAKPAPKTAPATKAKAGNKQAPKPTKPTVEASRFARAQAYISNKGKACVKSAKSGYARAKTFVKNHYGKILVGAAACGVAGYYAYKSPTVMAALAKYSKTARGYASKAVTAVTSRAKSAYTWVKGKLPFVGSSAAAETLSQADYNAMCMMGGTDDSNSSDSSDDNAFYDKVHVDQFSDYSAMVNA